MPFQNFACVALSSDDYPLVAIAVVAGGGIFKWQPMEPIIIGEPQSSTLVGASSEIISVAVTANESPYYQWLLNGIPIPNATNVALTPTNIQLDQAGNYSVLVSNAFGFTLSSNALLTVVPAFLTTQAANPSLYDAYLAASITTGSDGATLWFQWGVNTNYGQVTLPMTVEGPSALSVSNLITGLRPYTTYHCQAVSSNIYGKVLGGDVSFTTVPRFVQVGTNTDWSALVLCADGRELVATAGGFIYVSTNYGVEFVPTTGTGSVFAVSSNGSTIQAVSGSNIYTSMNSGSTWTTNSAPAAFHYFAASSDARNLAATDGSASVYTSTNFGMTWTQRAVPYAPTYGLACSADGSRIYGSSFPARETAAVYGSFNSGNTWASLGSFGALTGAGAIACSADGSIIAAADQAFLISINGALRGQPATAKPPMVPSRCLRMDVRS